MCNVTETELARAQSLTPVVSVQNRYNVADRTSESMVDLCEKERIVFLPWAPILDIENDATAAAMAAAHGATARQVVLAWLLARSTTILPIPGTGTVGHLDENIAAAGIQLERTRSRRSRAPAERKSRPEEELTISISSRHPTNAAKPGSGPDRPPAPAPPPPPRWRSWLLLAGVVATVALLFAPAFKSTPTKALDVHDVPGPGEGAPDPTASINPTGAVTGTLKGGESYTTQIPTALQDDALAPEP